MRQVVSGVAVLEVGLEQTRGFGGTGPRGGQMMVVDVHGSCDHQRVLHIICADAVGLIAGGQGRAVS